MANTEIVPVDTAGERVDPGSLHTARKQWAIAGSVLAAGDDPVDLIEARRTYQMYAGTLGDGKRDLDDTAQDCELAYLGQLVFVIGAQVATDALLMADTLTITESDWGKRWGYSINNGTVRPPDTITNTDRVVEGWIDLMGADVIIAVPTTLGTDAKLIVKGF